MRTRRIRSHTQSSSIFRQNRRCSQSIQVSSPSPSRARRGHYGWGCFLLACLMTLAVLGPGDRCHAAAVDYETLHSFGFTNLIGRNPGASLAFASDGRLYGTTRLGGRGNRGTVYTVAPDGSGFAVLHNFYGTNGGTPTAEVIEGADGRLYGTTVQGGVADKGVVYRMEKNGSGFELLHQFGVSENDGANPAGSLLEASDGWLYGTCSTGGTNDAGTLFSLQPAGGEYRTVRDLDPAEASTPQSGMIEARDGRLYGTLTRGGSADFGAVFGVGKDGSDFTVEHEFDGSDGIGPTATLTEGSDGALYGTAREGGLFGFGTVFRVSHRGERFTILWDFWGAGWDGFRPFGALVEGTDGGLYGTTAGGGVTEGGILFRINKDGTAYEILRSLGMTFAEGSNPFCGLVRVGGDRMVGATFVGGGSDVGTIFAVREDGSDYEVLWSFSVSGGDGVTARAGVIEGSDQALYGTTDAGGYFGQGTVYRLQEDGKEFIVLHDFTGTNGEGRGPVSALVEGLDGFLYGTTSGEETNVTPISTGTVFKLAKDGSQFAILHSFLVPPNRVSIEGRRPIGAPVMGQDGYLYGFTAASGTNGFGTLYRLSADGVDFEIIYQLNRTNGGFAGAAPIQGSDGMLYCVSSGSPVRPNGAVFRVSTNGAEFQLLRNFNGGDGSVPAGSLLEASDGRLFGITTNGGLAGRGAIFRMEKDGAHFTVLRSFRGGTRDGANPASSLIEAIDGELYGVTSHGGFRDRGVIYRIGKDGLHYSTLHHFYDSDPNGGWSTAGLVQSADGAFHGATPGGGDLGQGLIFRVTKRFPYLESTVSPYGFTFSFNGAMNQTYLLQRTTDFVDWATLKTLTLEEPFVQMEDTNAPPGAAFYRMLPQ